MTGSSEVSELAEQVGNFTHHWGFKRIHGRIWLHLFVSQEPLDAGGLIRRTGVSKALMSMSLQELLALNWIRPAGKSASKTQLFEINADIAAVLSGVLRGREGLLDQMHQAFEKVGQVPSDARAQWKLSSDRIAVLFTFIQLGRTTLSQAKASFTECRVATA